MTEVDLLERLVEACGDLCGDRIYLGDSVVTLEQEGYPALYAYHMRDQARDKPTQQGTRQIVTSQYGVYCVGDRDTRGSSQDHLVQLRWAVQDALIGQHFPGCLCAMRYVEGYRVRAEARSAVWLDVYSVDEVLVREPAP